MVELTAPTSKDTICDPASGTCGFLVNASEYMRDTYPEMLSNKKDRNHFHNTMFSGYDFDNTMLRIGSMNMLLHGVENPDINYRDSLSQDFALEEEKYSLILANPPFAGSIDIDSAAKDLLAVVNTKNTELLFLALFLKLLKPGGRAAIIIPDGVLFKNNKANKEIRRILVEDQKLDAVISLPSGVFKPYAGVSTAILLFTKTNSGGTDTVWFYDLEADGLSLDDNRKPLLDENKLGVNPSQKLTSEEHAKNNLPDLAARWNEREGKERKRSKKDQSFTVKKEEIVTNDYNLSLNRYKEIVHKYVEHAQPLELISELKALEDEIQIELEKLKQLLK
jgi:type I restriction enzyme M protein